MHSSPFSLDILSRLKGIETFLDLENIHKNCSHLWIYFPVWRELKLLWVSIVISNGWNLWIYFPVWRELKLISFKCHWFHLKRLWIYFPVWRELKLRVFHGEHANNKITLDILSRLKGIETGLQIRQWPREHCPLWIYFPVWRELKQVQYLGVASDLQLTLDILSRLKGIETNTYRSPKGVFIHSLWIYFPVWRELKLAVQASHYPSLSTLDILSRLKGIETSYKSRRRFDARALDILSRLKGIETKNAPIYRETTIRDLGGIPLDILSRLKGIETDTG